MHAILLPKRSVIIKGIIASCHNRNGYSGRNMARFWAINGNGGGRIHIFHCVTCRKLKDKFGEQNMADLPQ